MFPEDGALGAKNGAEHAELNVMQAKTRCVLVAASVAFDSQR